MGESFEWVEIIDHSRKERMFANLKTGQCLWDPPAGVPVKPTHENQWWELYDSNTKRYYYYNATTQKTVWRQPKDGDIIHLAKLQMLKAKEAERKGANNPSKNEKSGKGSAEQQNNVEMRSPENSDDGNMPTSLVEKHVRPPVAKKKLITADKQPLGNSVHKLVSYNDQGVSVEEMDILSQNGGVQRVIDNESENIKSANVERDLLSKNPVHTQSAYLQSFDSVAAIANEDDDEHAYENCGLTEHVYENVNPLGKHEECMSVSTDAESDLLEGEVGDEYVNIPHIPNSTVLAHLEHDSTIKSVLPSGSFVNIKSTTLPRTSSTGDTVAKPKFNSFRNKAPPKPPRTSMIDRNDSFQVFIEKSSNELTQKYIRDKDEHNKNVGDQIGTDHILTLQSNQEIALKSHLKPITVPITSSVPESSIMEIDRLSGTSSLNCSPESKTQPLSPYHSHKQDNSAVPAPPPLPPSLAGKPVRDSLDEDSQDMNESVPTDDSTTPSGTLLRTDTAPGGRTSFYERLNNEDDPVPARSSSASPSRSTRQLPQTPEPSRTTPVKRSPLTRMKSDSSDMEKRPKVSKTSEMAQQFRPVSMMNLSASSQMKPRRLASDSGIVEHVPLTTHRKGIFRRRMSIHSMLSWSKTPIKKPLVLTRDKQIRRESVEIFKLILQYMGDKSSRKNTDSLSVEITTKGWSNHKLRDEIYIQLCKQTTNNDKQQSLRRGWELITACLSMFPPSSKFHGYLEGYIYRNLESDASNTQAQVDVYAKHCYKQLDRICQTGAKRGLKGPTVEEIHAAVKRVFNPSMFGNSLEDVMEMQVERFPDNRLPWILTTLTDSVLLHNGLQTEGIFRVPGDIDEVNSLKLQIDKWQSPQNITEPHVPASLLKLWFRDLYEPLIPQRFYDQCIHNCDNEGVCLQVVKSLPPLNNLVFSYLIRLLQAFRIPENVAVSKMDQNNLAMVWAPNCLRCPSDDPREIFDNTRKEMTFLRTVMKALDTTFLEGVV